MKRIGLVLALACVLLAGSFKALADNATYSGSGGSFIAGIAAGQFITAQAIPMAGLNGTLSFSCPISSRDVGLTQVTWVCSGGAVSISGVNSTVKLNGTFRVGTMVLPGSDSGPVLSPDQYTLSAMITGTVTSGGVTQAFKGNLAVVVRTLLDPTRVSVPSTSVSLGWNSAYSPLVVGDNALSRLVGADNLQGTNRIAYGKPGNGTGQFTTIAGLAHDNAGRIYVTDSAVNRLVRIDDLSGKNWMELGSFGTGNLHFNTPLGVAVDSTGKILVADSANNRIVSFTDITGANWTSFGTAGSGANQFIRPSGIAFDAQGRIYVADTGNGRLVRFDDLTGKNWTTLSTISIPPYAYALTGITSVALSPTGQIYASSPTGMLYRVNDMTGAGAQARGWSPSIAGISVDPSGTLFVAGGFALPLAQMLDATGTGYFGGRMALIYLQPSAIMAAPTTTPPPPDPALSASSLAFGSRNLGEPSLAQHIIVGSIGAEPLAISSVTATPDYKVSDTCSAPLAVGSYCSIAVQLDPTATGSRPGTLSIASTSAHPVLEVPLAGAGTRPSAIVLPNALTFGPQVVGTSSAFQNVTLANTGTGPLTITSISVSGDFTKNGNCGARIILPGDGCTFWIYFNPSATGARTGNLTISDDAVPTGATQVVSLHGTGAAAAPTLTLSPQSLLFPDQQTGVASTAKTLTLKNGTAAAIALTPPVFPAGFHGSTNCGSSLAKAATCVINVQFAPTAAGPVTGAISVPIAGQAALTAQLSGTGVLSGAPAISITPGALDFGARVISDHPTMTLTLTNTSGLPVGFRSFVIDGPSAFSKTVSCPWVLLGHSSCTVQLTFTPLNVATYSATFTATEASGAATPIPLSGTASLDNGN